MKKLYLFIYIFFFIAKIYGYPLFIDYNSITNSNHLEKYREEKPFSRSLKPLNRINLEKHYFSVLEKETMDFHSHNSKFPNIIKEKYKNLTFSIKTLKEFTIKNDLYCFYYKKWKIDSSFPSDFTFYYLLNKKWSTAITYLNLTKKTTFIPTYKEEAENSKLIFKIPANGLDWGLYLTSHSLFVGLFAGINIGMSFGIETNKEIALLNFEYNIIPYGGIRAALHF